MGLVPMSDDQRFYEGDVIVVRGNEYEVEQVDITPSGDVLQYRLDAKRDDLGGTLRKQDDGLVIAEYYDVSGENITVIE
jgi:hypothetical protein